MRLEHPFDFALAIRTRRKFFGLTQTQLAARVGVSREWLIGLEHGRSSREFRMVIKLMEQLGFQVGIAWDEDAVPDWARPLKAAAEARITARDTRRAERRKGRPSPKAPADWTEPLSCSREASARASRDGRRRRVH